MFGYVIDEIFEFLLLFYVFVIWVFEKLMNFGYFVLGKDVKV